MRYIFLAEREAAHINDLSSSQHPSTLYFNSYPGMKTQKFPASQPRKDWFVPKYTDPSEAVKEQGISANNMVNQIDSRVLDVRVVGVVGTGVMGSGIAASLLMGRYVIKVELVLFIILLSILFCNCYSKGLCLPLIIKIVIAMIKKNVTQII